VFTCYISSIPITPSKTNLVPLFWYMYYTIFTAKKQYYIAQKNGQMKNTRRCQRELVKQLNKRCLKNDHTNLIQKLRRKVKQ